MNLIKAKQKFKEYISDFDSEDVLINYKIKHTYGVMQQSNKLATALNLSEEEIQLAELIGLLHDLARFNQAKQFKNFNDYETLDHADLAVKILFDDGLIREFIDESKFDEIISKSIKYHNKLKIGDDINEKELVFAKLIRDADKIDNISRFIHPDFLSKEKFTVAEFENSDISDEVYNDFFKSELIDVSKRKLPLDFWISKIAFAFDFYYPESIKTILEEQYIEKLFNVFDYKNADTIEKLEKMKTHILNFLNNQANTK